MNETNHPSSLATCTLIQDFLGVTDGGIYEAVVKQKQQLDAVVAECARVKLALTEITNSAEEAEYDGYFTFVVNPDAIHSAVDLIESETPAADAALAEVEAKAIEKFADEQKEKSSSADRAGMKHLSASHEFAEIQARAYVAKLREGRV